MCSFLQLLLLLTALTFSFGGCVFTMAVAAQSVPVLEQKLADHVHENEQNFSMLKDNVASMDSRVRSVEASTLRIEERTRNTYDAAIGIFLTLAALTIERFWDRLGRRR